MTPRQLLSAALVNDPARPLLTFYDDRTDERAELSVTTFGNWVAKTANLLVDGLDARPGQRVALHLPVHWQAAVWLSACWAAGLVAAPGAADGDITVVAADDPTSGQHTVSGEVVALGLGPLGLPRPGAAPPAYALDYDREIHAHGDHFVPSAPDDPHAPALGLPDAALTAGELGELTADAAARWALPPGSRILCAAPYGDVASVLAGLLVPLGARCGVVLARHLDEAKMRPRLAAEQVAAGNGLGQGLLPALPRVT
jgi:uncharacterized protein (TIGR03089 family)